VAIRLLALDIDGTLLRGDKSISARTLDALAAAEARGVRLVLVTGRRLPGARKVTRALGDGVPLVLHNGALIVVDGEVLRCRPLARDTARAAIRLGRQAGAHPVLHCGLRGEGRLVVDAAVDPANTLLAYYLGRSREDLVVVDDLLAWLDEDPIQVMFGGRLAEMETLVPLMTDGLGGAVHLERTVYPHEGVGILDVMTPGVNKGEALALLQARWGYTAAETMAIGDNWNDREMLLQAGIGYVMGNADPAMHQLGLPVLPTNEQDGVAVAIDRHVLGSLPTPCAGRGSG
jgi:Cof subfamily protein (haloacid dehalogenase superfamily)